jgi:hypothetical protein
VHNKKLLAELNQLSAWPVLYAISFMLHTRTTLRRLGNSIVADAVKPTGYDRWSQKQRYCKAKTGFTFIDVQMDLNILFMALDGVHRNIRVALVRNVRRTIGLVPKGRASASDRSCLFLTGRVAAVVAVAAACAKGERVLLFALLFVKRWIHTSRKTFGDVG